MMQEKDKWDVIVVLKMDRIHRNSKNFTAMMEDLNKWRKEFNSMQESFDTTSAIGRFVMDIIQRIAQLESEQIGERVKVGMLQKARNGKGYLGFGEPYGYRYQNGQLIAIETELKIVRKIYHWYEIGLSIENIARKLNEMNIPSKKGGCWKKGTVWKILSNPLYCGYIKWDELMIKAPHEPVISIEEFNSVQELKRSRQKCHDMASSIENDRNQVGVVID